jgi:hypothetical protein
MAGYIRIASQAGALLASGWLLREPDSEPVWELGLALVLGSAAVIWMVLHEA